MKKIELFGNTYVHGKVGDLDVWNSMINKENLMYYRIYKTNSRWVLFLVTKNKPNEILYQNLNLEVNVPPLSGWNKVEKLRKILVYTIGSLNILQGCANNTINLCILLSKLNNTSVHLLLRENINHAIFSKDLLNLKNLIIHEPSHFNLKQIDHMNYAYIINKLDSFHNYAACFIRTAFDVNQNLPNINKSVFFIHYTNAKNPKLLSRLKNIFFSNKVVMDECLKKYKLSGKNCTEIFPMVRNIGDCKQMLNNVINICYLGSFKKDYLVKEFINVFRNVKTIRNHKICFYIYGNTFKDYSFNRQTLLKISNDKNNNILYKGAIKNENIEAALKNMHFGLSIRTKRFDNHLDLSSKLIDYTRNGVVPLCNKAKINEYILGDDFRGYTNKPCNILTKIRFYIENPDVYIKDKITGIEGSKKLLHENYLSSIDKFINNI